MAREPRMVSIPGLVLPELPEGYRFDIRHTEPDVWPEPPRGVTVVASVATLTKTLWWESWYPESSLGRYLIDLRKGIDYANETLAVMAQSAHQAAQARALTS